MYYKISQIKEGAGRKIVLSLSYGEDVFNLKKNNTKDVYTVLMRYDSVKDSFHLLYISQIYDKSFTPENTGSLSISEVKKCRPGSVLR